MSKPFYRLKELIEEKYGAGDYRFKTGCKLVGQWLSVGDHAHWSCQNIMNLCAIQKDYLTPAQKELLRQLFGLEKVDHLLNK